MSVSSSSSATMLILQQVVNNDWARTTLRDAWKLLRFHHPSIASTPLAESDSLEYMVPSENDLEPWVQQTYVVIEDQSAADLIAEMKPGHFLTLHFLPDTWEIILHTSHWRTDGYGAFQLLNAFFGAVKMVIDNDNALPTLSWGEEVTRLVPSVESALNLPETATPEITASAIKYGSTHAHLKDSVGVPYKTTTTGPGGTRAVRMQLSPEATQAIQRATNDRQLDMYAAIHAALAKVNFQYATPSSSENENEYASGIRLSVRPHLLKPFTNNPSVAAGLYTGGYVFKVTASDDFHTTIKKYQHEYENGASPEFIHSRRQFAATVLNGLGKGLPPPKLPLPNMPIDVSFVTGVDDMVKSVFDTKHGPLEVSRVGLGVETLTQQPYLSFWIFREQLDLSLVYNEAYQDEEEVRKMLSSVVEVLDRELLGSK